MPLLVLGMVIVPVTPEATGPTAGDASPVAPIGMPVVPNDAPATVPNGEVAPIGGVTVPTWANAGPQHSKGHAAAARRKDLMEHFSDKSGWLTWRAAARTAVSRAAGMMDFFFTAGPAHG
jgi:hypothetical protein